MEGQTILLFSLAVFLSIGAIVFVLLSTYATRAQVRNRVRAGLVGSNLADPSLPPKALSRLIALNDRVLAGRPEKLSQLRLDLQIAGFFAQEAPQVFLLLRLVSMIAVPVVGLALTRWFLPDGSTARTLLLVLILVVVGFVLPQAVLDRLKAVRIEENRRAFPDLLDMLVVCTDAGLAFEAALQRLAHSFGARSRLLGLNLQVLSAELRAGRATPDALDGLAARLGLEEAKSFSTLLKQSLELGSDVGSALRVYSEEMRDKRIASAEERANRLPVLMVIPLGLLVFPVILIIIMYPTTVRIMDTLKNFTGG
jgi:tight adherence protein C